MKPFETYQIEGLSRKLRIIGSIFLISISLFLCRSTNATPELKRYASNQNYLLDQHGIFGNSFKPWNNTCASIDPIQNEANSRYNCSIQEDISKKKFSSISGQEVEGCRKRYLEKIKEEYNSLIARIVHRLEKEVLEGRIEEFYDI